MTTNNNQLLKDEIIYQSEFIFNELKYFTDLLNKEDITEESREEILGKLELTNIDYKFIYMKDRQGSWFKHCYKGNEKISWNDIAFWMRPYIWDYEKENRMFQ